MDNPSCYAKQEYWESRYKTEEAYDWFNSRYNQIIELLIEKITSLNPTKKIQILNLGCGNSSLSQDMYLKGFKDITNIDYSLTVIEKMSKKYKEIMPEMKWKQMDVRKLDFKDNTFDIIIDKGTMDAIQADKNSDTLDDDIDNMLSEVSRILKSGGMFFQISWEQPYFRKYWTVREKFEWDLEYEKIGDDDLYILYTYIKK